MEKEFKDERRKFSRVDFDASVRLLQEENEWKCHLIDISLKGALIEYPDNWQGKPGDQFILEISLNKELVVIKMEVNVSHIEGHQAGFHCEHIDIDSIVHLRRLMELNLGDSELINREIVELGKWEN